MIFQKTEFCEMRDSFPRVADRPRRVWRRETLPGTLATFPSAPGVPPPPPDAASRAKAPSPKSRAEFALFRAGACWIENDRGAAGRRGY
mmetsp:Transcript_6723/g.22712  ORF Transcript_6723/g.22712 Transcript_6723/m.22712 type:complete len:89 (+) Transcript_6723:1371-1637(+)